MKNKEQYKPSKYIYHNEKLIASRNTQEIGISSRLIADIVAEFYDQNLKLHAKGKLLDLGCGKVPLYNAYKEFVTENICVDWGNTLHENEFLDFECDLTKDLPFERESFDTIILSDVLEHIPQPEHLWKEMARILRINGKIIMNVPFYYFIHASPFDYYRYTEFALRRFVEQSGLNLVELRSIGGTPEILTDILGKHLQFIPWFGAPLVITLQSITKFFLKTAIGKKLSAKTAVSFPLGYVLIAEKLAQ